MKRGKKMFIIILSTLGVLGLITWGAIAYFGRSQTLSIKSIENPSGDLYLIHITKPSHQIRTFWSVAFPIVKPGFAALAIFTFINTWNDYFMQLVMLTSRNNLTISLGVATMQAEMATNYGLIMAGAALAAVPIVAVFLIFQKSFTQGITMGAVKR